MSNMWQDAWEAFNERNYQDYEDNRPLEDTYLDYKLASEGIYPDDPNYGFWRGVFTADLKYQMPLRGDERKAA